MRICVWYELSASPTGGANSFIKGLVSALRKQGHDVLFRPQQDCDVVLLNSWSRGPGLFLTKEQVCRLRNGTASFFSIFGNLLGGKRRHPALIHRLDGVARLYGRFDGADERQMAINPLTDGTVFQSRFCQESFCAQGVVPGWSRVIHNGVDSTCFFPMSPGRIISSDFRLLAVSWSGNPLKGFATLVKLAEQPHVKVTFVGNWCTSIAPGKVQLLGVKNHSEVAVLMREHDAFIHAAENDPCPNVVIEALASGLPLLFNPSGGTRELAENYGVPLGADIRESISLLRQNYALIREHLLEDRPRFSIETTAREYVEAFVVLRETLGYA